MRPQDLSGDLQEIFARVKIAAEQPRQVLTGFPEIPRLGAPFQADWRAYPTPDDMVFLLTGQLARLAGLFCAVKLMGTLFYVLNALSFYLSARYLRWRTEWAVAGALLFAFSNYNIRWEETLSFNQTFTLPPLVLLCAHAAKAGRAMHPAQGWLPLGILLGAWLGMGNPYLGFFAGLLGFSTLSLALIRRCAWSRLRPLVGFLATLIGVFLLANLGHTIHFLTAEGGTALERNYAGSLVYALKPLDWLIPPTEHRLDWVARLGLHYRNHTQIMGDFFAGYLGLAGLVGLAGIGVLALHRLAKRPARPVPDAALGLVLLLVFAAAGGINSLLSLVGLDVFRASQRITILVNIWALFFLFGWMQRRLAGQGRWVTLAVAAIVTLFCWWEQTPRLVSRKNAQNDNPQWNAMRQLTGRLESELGPEAMIFQLPVRRFPEAGPLKGMTDYEHFRPFLTETSLRFSYGNLAQSQELAWQKFVTRLPAAELLQQLEQSGFAAVWINPRAYGDGGARLIRELDSLQRTEIDHGTDAPIRVIRLKPAAVPTRPDLDDLRINHAWSDPAPHSKLHSILAINGWYPLEQDGFRRWRWAAKRAEIGIWWPDANPQAVLKFKVAVLRDRVIELHQNGQTLLQLALTKGELRAVELPLTLTPGGHRLVWTMRGEPSYPRRGDTRQLGFRIEDLEVGPAEDPRP